MRCRNHKIHTPLLLTLLPVVLFLFMPPSPGLFAYDNVPGLVSGEFWLELDPMPIEKAQFEPAPRTKEINMMLEEARFVFSGMVYGFSFTYTPSDKMRAIGEIFELTPVAEIPWGSPALEVRQTYIRNGNLYAVIDYRLAEYEGDRIRSWQTNSFPLISGQGKAAYLPGPEQKIAAHADAVKLTIREYLRGLTYNKPKSASGRLVFAEPPRVFAGSGSFISTVDLKLLLDELEPYGGY